MKSGHCITGAVWLSLPDRTTYYRVRVHPRNGDGSRRSRREIELEAIDHVIIRLFGIHYKFLPARNRRKLCGQLARRSAAGYAVCAAIPQVLVVFHNNSKTYKKRV